MLKEMVRIKCDINKGGCGMVYEIDEEKCRKEKYIQCPNCGEQGLNIFYESSN